MSQRVVDNHDSLCVLPIVRVLAPVFFYRFAQVDVRVGQQVRVVVEPVEQFGLFLRVLVRSFRGEKSLHLCVFGSGSPFLAKQLVDEAGRLFVGWVVGVDESAFLGAVVLLGIVPEQETDVFVVCLVVVIMVADGIEREIVARLFLIFRDECPPYVQAGYHVLEISRHTHTDLDDIFLFERVRQVGLFHHFMYLIGNTGIIKVGRT